MEESSRISAKKTWLFYYLLVILLIVSIGFNVWFITKSRPTYVDTTIYEEERKELLRGLDSINILINSNRTNYEKACSTISTTTFSQDSLFVTDYLNSRLNKIE